MSGFQSMCRQTLANKGAQFLGGSMVKLRRRPVLDFTECSLRPEVGLGPCLGGLGRRGSGNVRVAEFIAGSR